MSCRVIGRTVEEFTCADLIERAERMGYRRILGEFLPTKKNALVAELYDRMGFRQLDSGDGSSVLYELELAGASRPVHYLSPKGAVAEPVG